jgi:hypothetical protein
MYPKAHQLLHDEDYLLILRDMLNLSAVLDDMEFTGERWWWWWWRGRWCCEPAGVRGIVPC